MSETGKLTYIYKPIDSENSEFRILTVDLDIRRFLDLSSTAPFTGTLTSHYLPRSDFSRRKGLIRSLKLPVYHALSYVWGDPTRTHEIWVDGKRLAITANLYAALRDLQQDAVGIKMRVWADAICINQDDPTERSAQIRLMREVYHLSAEVRIWLGPRTAETLRCQRFIARLTDDAVPSEDPEPPAESTPMDKYIDTTVEVIVGTGLKAAGGVVGAGYKFGQTVVILGEWMAPVRDNDAEMFLESSGNLSLHQDTIEELAKWRPKDKWLEKVAYEGDFAEVGLLIDKTLIQDRDWFQRMWVVQELATASSVSFQVGVYALRWESFMRAVHYLHYVRNIRMDNIRKVTVLEKIRMGWSAGKRQPLRELLREFRYKQATDPRDKVYALLGLMGDHINEYLKPDYSKPVNEVYANVALYFIGQSKSLDCLCGQQILGRRDDLPSWVPDLSLHQDLIASSLVPTDGQESIYSASGYDYRSHFVLPALSREIPSSFLPWSPLCTQGLYIDIIARISDPETENASFGQIEKQWLATLLTASDILGGLTEDVRHILETISSTVGAYSAFFSSASSPNILSYVAPKLPNPLIPDLYIPDAYLQGLLSGRISLRERITKDTIEAIMSLRLPPNADLPVIDAPIVNFCRAFEAGMRRRRLVVTRGGYIGAVPDHARLGDVVCVLFGCSVPVILRKHVHGDGNGNGGDEGTYMFVGEAYLHGFMDGEAIALQVRGERDVRDFVLS